MIDILAYHGWGFDRTCWSPWHDYLVQREAVQFQASDRGYFGQPQDVIWSEHSERKLLLIHSFGLHLCPLEQLLQADAIALFNSFLDFHPPSERPRKRSQQIVTTMIHQFQQQPHLVLQNFWAKCGWSPEEQRQSSILDQLAPVARTENLTPIQSKPSLNDEVLLADLKILNTQQLSLEIFQSCPEIWIIHAHQDRIVSRAQTEAIVADLGDRAHWIELDGDHATPLNPTSWSESANPCFHAQFFRA